jgi:hypothetical protein
LTNAEAYCRTQLDQHADRPELLALYTQLVRRHERHDLARRGRHRPITRRYFERPRWNGATLEGRTILLWMDATIPEAICSIRFVDQVKLCGGTIIVEADRDLLPLFQQVNGVDRVLARHMPLPRFDVHTPLSLLPDIFERHLETVPPRVPYLQADARLVEIWHRRLAGSTNVRVGLVWDERDGFADSDASVLSLDTLSALSEVDDITFISLQRGGAAADVVVGPAQPRVERILHESSSLSDIAAIMQNLSLVIVVEGSVAHLAVALGIPVWILLPDAADSQRRLKGDRSLWYPTARIFRQTRRDSWADVLENVRAELQAFTVRLRQDAPVRRDA